MRLKRQSGRERDELIYCGMACMFIHDDWTHLDALYTFDFYLIFTRFDTAPREAACMLDET
jgi:hypothetical protein